MRNNKEREISYKTFQCSCFNELKEIAKGKLKYIWIEPFPGIKVNGRLPNNAPELFFSSSYDKIDEKIERGEIEIAEVKIFTDDINLFAICRRDKNTFNGFIFSENENEGADKKKIITTEETRIIDSRFTEGKKDIDLKIEVYKDFESLEIFAWRIK